MATSNVQDLPRLAMKVRVERADGLNFLVLIETTRNHSTQRTVASDRTPAEDDGNEVRPRMNDVSARGRTLRDRSPLSIQGGPAAKWR